MSELPADRRTARQAAERHYPTRRSPLSRLSPLGRRSPDKRRTDATASLICWAEAPSGHSEQWREPQTREQLLLRDG